jgi:hypothetical protein
MWTNPFTIPSPIPGEAPVTMAVFGGPLMAVCLENILSLETERSSGESEISVQQDVVLSLASFKSSENVVDIAVGEGSVCGATLCREAESSIVSIAAGVNGNNRISLMALRIRA